MSRLSDRWVGMAAANASPFLAWIVTWGAGIMLYRCGGGLVLGPFSSGWLDVDTPVGTWV